jgi:hypothetical protein
MTNFVEFPCPHCSKNIRTNARYLGMKGQCPHCGKAVKVEAPAGQVLQPVTAETASRPSTTHANTILAGLLGAGATVVLYVLFLAVHGTYLGKLMLDRGPIQFIITFVTCWGLAILVLKYLAVREQLSYTELELEFIPLDLGFKIEPKNVGEFLKHLDGLPKKAKRSILGRRIHGALEHFRERSSVPEVQSYLASHGGIDASMVDAGYTLLRAFIWAIPLFGFIGTVTGISKAVTGLADSLESANGPPASVAPAVPGAGAAEAPGGTTGQDKEANLGNKMIGAMGLVTQGLATAFDTTFLGLVTAILLLFPTETLKRIEYSMLDRIETFTNESLLRRMDDQSENAGLSPDAARLLEPVFRRHQQWLIEWQNQVADLGNVIGQDFEKHAAAIQHTLERRESDTANEVSRLADSLSQLVGHTQEVMTRLQETSTLMARDLNASCDRLKETSAAVSGDLKSRFDNTLELQQQLAANTSQMRELAGQWQAAQVAATRAVQGGQLEQVLSSLDRTVMKLTELVAQAGPAVSREAGDGRAKSSWWPFNRSR